MVHPAGGHYARIGVDGAEDCDLVLMVAASDGDNSVGMDLPSQFLQRGVGVEDQRH